VRSTEVLKIIEILRKVSKSLVRDFYEIITLQNSKGLLNFFSNLCQRTELFLSRELKKFKHDLCLQDDVLFFAVSGKKNLLRGIPHFAIAVMLKRKNKPYLTVIEAPIIKTTFWAQVGCGAFFEDLAGIAKLKVKSVLDMQDNLVLLDTAHSLLDLKSLDCRFFAACVMDAVYVACAKADAFVLNAKNYNSDLILLCSLLVQESGGVKLKAGDHIVLGSAKIAQGIQDVISQNAHEI
jgi:myo-inositol-1(or 4)-monophosphatase